MINSRTRQKIPKMSLEYYRAKELGKKKEQKNPIDEINLFFFFHFKHFVCIEPGALLASCTDFLF